MITATWSTTLVSALPITAVRECRDGRGPRVAGPGRRHTDSARATDALRVQRSTRHDFGPIELTLGEQVFTFDNEPDGESLRITELAWIDPFAEPLTTENREFVERSGKWTAFDVSADSSWAGLLGEVLSEVEPIMNSAHKLTGVILRTERGGVVRLGVMADELFLDGLVTPGWPYPLIG